MNDATNDAASTFAPLWRRKWMILAIAVLVAGGTYAYYKRKPAIYTAHTSLYLGAAAEQAGAQSGSGKSTLSGRALIDQVELINTTVGEQVHRRLRAEHRLVIWKGKAKATASTTSDFINIVAEAHKPKAAVVLANEYAAAYIRRQLNDYRHNLRTQIANTQAQLRRIEGSAGKGKGSKSTSTTTTIQAANLESKISQLETQLVGFTGVQQVAPAKAQPVPIYPTPKKNAIFGLLIGLIIGAVAAYLLDRFDRRLRSLGAVEVAFHTQILAPLPSVGSPVLRPGGARAPAASLLEPLRRLYTTVKLGHGLAGEGPPRSLLFLSPDAGDGRSSVVANLATVLRDSGERVAVVEADFRRPMMGKLMGAEAARGLADVLTGTATPAAAMQPVLAPGTEGATLAAPSDGAAVATAVEPQLEGSIDVLLSGAPVANPPALLASRGMGELLRALVEDHDYVLVDAPPPLEFSDVMPLLPLVDGIVVVARIGHTRETSAERLTELLSLSATAPILGAVVNCVPRKAIERYGFSLASSGGRRRKLIGR